MISQINFTGLTKNFSRKPYNKLDSMKKLAESSNTSIAGKLPSDITNEILKNNPNPQNAIKELYSGFAQSANILQSIFVATNECAQNFKVFPVWEKIYDLRYSEDLFESRRFVEKVFLDSKEVVKKEKEITKKAQDFLTQACKKAGVIPQGGSVKIYGIGQGSFGAAYELRFLNEANEEIFHSKVMKIFPLTKEEKDAVIELKIAKNALYNLINSDDAPINQEEYEKLKNEARKRLSEPSSPQDKFLRRIRPEIDVEDIHGFLPETNRALYINKKLGKDSMRANFAPFYYSDLRNNFFIMEKVDRNLPSVDKNYEVHSLGLFNTDTNKRNVVCSRLVDYGGLQATNQDSSNNIYFDDSSSW